MGAQRGPGVFRTMIVVVSVTTTMACGAPPTHAETAPCVATDDNAPPAPPPSSPPPSSGVAGAREVECNAFPDAVTVRLSLSDDYEHLRGTATDHYDMAEYSTCTSDDREIVCDGTWRSGETSATLRIGRGRDGTIVGRIVRHARGEETLSCIAH